MKQKQLVVLQYLRGIIAAMEPALESKEDKGKQTLAVEAMMKRLLSGPLSSYSDMVFSVGGSVRDEILGKIPKDLDLVVVNDSKKMDSAKDFANALVSVLDIKSERQPQVLNESYGIYGVTLFRRDEAGKRIPFLVGSNGEIVDHGGTDVSGYRIEITPPRKEMGYAEDSRSPISVEYASVKEDQERRDLTINAVYKNLVSGKHLDFVGGLKDIENKTLRPPEQSEGGRTIEDIYKEDPLRILRLVRFSDKIDGGKTPSNVVEVVRNFVRGNKDFILKKLSKERIAEEFKKIITGNDPVKGLETMKDMGILWLISPDLEKMLDVYHDTVFHSGESVWEHTMDVLGRTPPTAEARIAALFHDIGKVGTKPDPDDPEGKKRIPIVTKKTDPQGRERVQFIGHELASGRMIRKILKDLKMDSIAETVAQIAESHMGFKSFGTLKDKTLLKRMRILIERLYNNLDDAISILKADEGNSSEVDKLEMKINKLKDEDMKSGILRERGGKIEYVVPIDYAKAMEEYSELKGALMGMVTTKLKEALVEGKITDEISAKKQLDSLMKNSTQLEMMLAKHKKEKGKPDFYTVR